MVSSNGSLSACSERIMDDVEVYYVSVEGDTLPPAQGPTVVKYLVIAGSDEEALSLVQGVIPYEWNAVGARKGLMTAEQIAQYRLRAGRVHQL
jgi:hypothetical protein